MIQSFTITNHLGESIFLDIRKPEDTGFLITSVSGLDSPKAEVSTTNYASYDGSHVGNIRAEERNIVFSILFYENNNEQVSVETLRHRCYTYFPIKQEITIEVTNDSGTYVTTGIVESNETNIFTQTEGAQISVICPDSYFWKSTSDRMYLWSARPLFEFPVEFDDYVEFGGIDTYPEYVLNYTGVGNNGLIFTIHATGSVDGFVIYELSRRLSLKISTQKLIARTGYGIVNRDVITIDTRKGRKSATLLRNGHTYNILSCIETGGEWLNLQPGDNHFAYDAASGRSKLYVYFDYETNYYGV